MRRTQIYLDERQDARLAQRARAAGRSKSDLIREAVERLLDRAEGADGVEGAPLRPRPGTITWGEVREQLAGGPLPDEAFAVDVAAARDDLGPARDAWAS